MKNIGLQISNNFIDIDEDIQIQAISFYLEKLYIKGKDFIFSQRTLTNDFVLSNTAKVYTEEERIKKKKYLISNPSPSYKDNDSFLLRCDKNAIMPHELYISREIFRNSIEELNIFEKSFLVNWIYPNRKINQKHLSVIKKMSRFKKDKTKREILQSLIYIVIDNSNQKT